MEIFGIAAHCAFDVSVLIDSWFGEEILGTAKQCNLDNKCLEPGISPRGGTLRYLSPKVPRPCCTERSRNYFVIDIYINLMNTMYDMLGRNY